MAQTESIRIQSSEPSYPAIFENADSSCYEEIQGQLVKSATGVVDLLRIYRSQYGYNRASVYMTQVFYLALNVLIRSNEEHQHDIDIKEICIALRATAHRFPFATGLLRLVRADVRRLSLNLPVAAEKLFDDFYEENVSAWRRRDVVDDSLYPVHAGTTSDRFSDSEDTLGQ